MILIIGFTHKSKEHFKRMSANILEFQDTIFFDFRMSIVVQTGQTNIQRHKHKYDNQVLTVDDLMGHCVPTSK